MKKSRLISLLLLTYTSCFSSNILASENPGGGGFVGGGGGGGKESQLELEAAAATIENPFLLPAEFTIDKIPDYIAKVTTNAKKTAVIIKRVKKIIACPPIYARDGSLVDSRASAVHDNGHTANDQKVTIYFKFGLLGDILSQIWESERILWTKCTPALKGRSTLIKYETLVKEKFPDAITKNPGFLFQRLYDPREGDISAAFLRNEKFAALGRLNVRLKILSEKFDDFFGLAVNDLSNVDLGRDTSGAWIAAWIKNVMLLYNTLYARYLEGDIVTGTTFYDLPVTLDELITDFTPKSLDTLLAHGQKIYLKKLGELKKLKKKKK